jgi:hypothetical protein
MELRVIVNSIAGCGSYRWELPVTVYFSGRREPDRRIDGEK